jgi:thioredoxin 1
MSKEITLTDDTFESTVANSALPILVDFWAPWCGPCRFVGPILSEIAEEQADRITIAKLNVDDNPRSAHRFGVSSIPTMIVFKGGKAVERIVGALPKAQLEKQIAPHLA